MSPEKAVKASRLPVLSNADDSYAVVGDSAVYEVTPSRVTGEMRCNCDAFRRYGQECSHLLAVISYIREAS